MKTPELKSGKYKARVAAVAGLAGLLAACGNAPHHGYNFDPNLGSVSAFGGFDKEGHRVPGRYSSGSWADCSTPGGAIASWFDTDKSTRAVVGLTALAPSEAAATGSSEPSADPRADVLIDGVEVAGHCHRSSHYHTVGRRVVGGESRPSKRRSATCHSAWPLGDLQGGARRSRPTDVRRGDELHGSILAR
ncbi:MAG TPA: hypothetical protein VJP80_06050 [Candidatus Saccharimonadales bacterium]|nr:hypothetical protein [Candidatus Saccharimonadales bacterium]